MLTIAHHMSGNADASAVLLYLSVQYEKYIRCMHTGVVVNKKANETVKRVTVILVISTFSEFWPRWCLFIYLE